MSNSLKLKEGFLIEEEDQIIINNKSKWSRKYDSWTALFWTIFGFTIIVRYFDEQHSLWPWIGALLVVLWALKYFFQIRKKTDEVINVSSIDRVIVNNSTSGICTADFILKNLNPRRIELISDQQVDELEDILKLKNIKYTKSGLK